jgi:hypothetical protein
LINCPGAEHGFSFFTNSSGSYRHWDNSSAYISSVFPQNLTDVFTSATNVSGGTVSGTFDIQYRKYVQVSDQNVSKTLSDGTVVLPPYIDQGKPQTNGVESLYTLLVLEDDFLAIEGLVVDMKQGGVGFRNHTVPADVADGVSWSEDLLWMAPETVCVDSNLTLDFQVGGFTTTQLILVDRGGFVNLQSDYPFLDFADPQSNPMLKERAHKMAVLNNYNILLYFNGTRNHSFIGKEYNFGNDTNFDPGQVSVQIPSAGPLVPGTGLLDSLFSFFPDKPINYLDISRLILS